MGTMAHLVSSHSRKVGLEAAIAERFGWTFDEIDDADYDRLEAVLYYLAQKDAAEERRNKPPGGKK